MAKTTRSTTTMPGTQTSRRVTKSKSLAVPTEEQIRQRAFEIYLMRNGGPGDALSDWIQAERELREGVSVGKQT